jgi:DNA-binding NarL/FixJ family response regulator
VIPAVRALAGGKPFHSPLSGAVINPADLDGHRTTLADREPEILMLLAQGKTNKQVAAALDVSFTNGRSPASQPMRKLDLRSLSDLIYYAIRNRIVEDVAQTPTDSYRIVLRNVHE